ncbi:mechanosensitive ion channel family protein [Nocardia asteroides]
MRTSSSAIDYQQGLSDAWASMATFVPRLAGFLVILLIGWLVAKAIAAIVAKVLTRAGFDRLAERGGIRQMLSRGRYDAGEVLAKLAYYAILLIALQLGFGVFGPNPVSDTIDGVVAWLPKAGVAIVVLVIAGAVAHAVRDLVGGLLGGLSYGALAGRIAAVFVWGVGIVAALDQIGVATVVTLPILVTVLATIGGILVVGIGGGMIRPMQQRWENWLGSLEEEMPAVRGHAAAYRRGREEVAREQLWMDQQAARGQRWADEPGGDEQWRWDGAPDGEDERWQGGPARSWEQGARAQGRYRGDGARHGGRYPLPGEYSDYPDEDHFR